MNLPEHQRAYIYRIVLAAIPLLVLYGLLSEAEAAEWGYLVAAILGVAADSLAVKNTTTKRDG